MRQHAEGDQPEHGSWLMDSPAKARRKQKRAANAKYAEAPSAAADEDKCPVSSPLCRSPRNSSRSRSRAL
eukprot:6206581-Pleurochrysis_carterae.AAC.4